MAIEVDPAFRNSGATARRRQRQRRIRRGIALAAIVVSAGLGGWLVLGRGAPEADLPDDDFAMIQTEEADSVGIERLAPLPSADIQTDPMILRLGEGDAGQTRSLPGPAEGFEPARVGLPGPERLTVLRSELIARDQRVQVVLPSSSADFALFQAQRSQGIAAMQQGLPALPQAPVDAGTTIAVAEDSSWGDFISADADADVQTGAEAGTAVYVETRIENTTSTALALREERRSALYEDDIIAVTHERQLAELVVEAGFSPEAATEITAAAARLIAAPATLDAGAVLALRSRPDPEGRVLLQMSLYRLEGYLGTLVQTGFGRYEPGADPWFADNLLNHAGRMRQEKATRTDIRLIDAVYSAGLSAGLSTRLVGELIVALSKPYDLDRFANPGDRLTLLYASEPGSEGQGVGQILFAGLEGPSGEMPCYVLPLPNRGGFACFDFSGRGGGGAVGGLGGGMVVPVKGVKTSGFGPRHHPILKQVRNHNGVDWAAPTGTPVGAALAGTARFVGDGGAYGNVVYIDHADGAQTRYAHLNAFAEGLKQGQAVQAGQVIGFVGTTGRSTGPHLHFELHIAGAPVDPLTWRAVGVVSDGGQAGSEAVEALVNQIIKVESGGNATAKNPLSSATGLGQFINSTWLRMMRDYRPDLFRSMSQAELLNLRFDPALSREMVRNLARENESFLRARGRPIRAGTLYLAHFLGPAGAATALGADPNASVLEVMGAGVVNANPFLRNMTVADMVAWSDRKMSGKKGAVAVTNGPVAAPVVVSAEAKAFREAVDAVLEGV
ncbi:peptidoglycan DD-metalloendopeptidase family protein [Thetidibacter halocola]|uniref:Peptidoglycan DD-metalloendopeptidase family protein n=1 Tax=Thetidibacter halocola TaxID=2827239 RepID=A0A8J8B626_9RHOB|nr:peptidoglycan DD-metalloendopeptidase family protein [Thetidibacter halocola]MBS0123556.1 peptidoglycan DD-metalloendopeptidase family protein [Thetidibacter halocola]